MNRGTKRMCGVGTAAAILLLAAGPLAAASLDATDALPLTQGNVWLYTVDEGPNTIATAASVRVDASANPTYPTAQVYHSVEAVEKYYLHSDASLGLRQVYEEENDDAVPEYVILDPYRPYLPAVAVSGQTYSGSFSVTAQELEDGQVQTITGTAASVINHEGLESVTVGAGAFTCHRISRVEQLTATGGQQRTDLTTVSWYAPGVGIVKQQETETDYELQGGAWVADDPETKTLSLAAAQLATTAYPADGLVAAVTLPDTYAAPVSTQTVYLGLYGGGAAVAADAYLVLSGPGTLVSWQLDGSLVSGIVPAVTDTTFAPGLVATPVYALDTSSLATGMFTWYFVLARPGTDPAAGDWIAWDSQSFWHGPSSDSEN